MLSPETLPKVKRRVKPKYMSQPNHLEHLLFEFLKIPSVSAQSGHRADCLRAAQWVGDYLRSHGFSVESLPSHPQAETALPVVIGRFKAKNPQAKTLLIYGHYDVQPAEPFAEWIDPPFSPTVRDGKVFARGATDNKGQIFSLMAGMAQAVQNPDLNLNLIFLVEGEEEIGSQFLQEFMATHRQSLACDYALISDSPQFGPGQPALCYGLKGLTYFEITLRGPGRDLHSGSFGGLVKNPALALCELLAGLSDHQGKVLLPGFYDDVLDLSPEERALFAKLPNDEAALKENLGTQRFFGESDYSYQERRFARPTFDVHGIKTGYQEEGAKTVIPKEATAKFGFRLVPNQDPKKVEAALRAYLAAHCPSEVQYSLKAFHACPPVLVDRHHPCVAAAQKAITESFGQAPLFIREGGSIPVVGYLKDILNVETLLIGLGLPTDGAHAPNEHMTLADFHRGQNMAAALARYLGLLK